MSPLNTVLNCYIFLHLSDLRMVKVGVGNDDDIDSDIETVSWHLSKAEVGNVDSVFLLNLCDLSLIVLFVFQCILTTYSYRRFVMFKNFLVVIPVSVIALCL